MPARFNYVVCSIEESNDITTMSIDSLQSSLIVQESRMKRQVEFGEEQALKVSNPGRGFGRGRGRNNTSRGRWRGRQSKEFIECFKCHKLSHYQSECTEEEGHQDWMFDFDNSYRDSVKLGDDSRMTVMGKGSVKLLINNKVHVISNVYFVLGLKTNLLSIGQLQQKQIIVIFKDDMCKIYHENKGLLFTTAMSNNKIYVVSATVIDPMQMVKGLPEFEEVEDNCVDCLAGKQARDSVPKQSNWRATTRLELVHSDICGPITPQSNGGSRYFMTLTDDFSRKTWIYVLKEKSSAFESFKFFKALVEKESGCAIQCLRTERGGEYTSNAFNDFCSKEGIKRQLTAAYTPQQNGVSERKNRTLLNMVRSMISARGVPKRFWPEAVKWAAYVMNRSPTLSVKDVTPEEAWSGKKPSVHHFKTFGCIGHVTSMTVKEGNWTRKTKNVFCLESKQAATSDDWEEVESESEAAQHDIEGQATADTHEIENENENVIINDTSSDSEYERNSPLGARIRKPSVRLNDYVTGRAADEDTDEELHNLAVINTNEDPLTYSEAVKFEVLRQTMDAEIEAIKSNDTWELTTLPAGCNPIGVKWIYKTKFNEKGEIDKYKARLVAKGYTQKYGIDYNEVFAPVARWDTIRAILAFTAGKGWNIFQLDVKSAFLHGDLSEDIYVNQPLGYVTSNKNMVYKLKKALYGLKQAPRAWYSKIESYFIAEKFEKCPYEHTLFVKYGVNDEILVVSLYVDDLIYTGNNQKLMDEFKSSMKKKFAMTDLGKMRYFLDLAWRIVSSKQSYSPWCKLVTNENEEATDATLYKQMVGCLMYLLATRPDLAYSVCLVARFMDKPTEMHVTAVKRIMRYLKGTLSFGIVYRSNTKTSMKLKGWCDSDYAGDLNDRKSTTDYVFMLGSGAISWSSKKQPIVTLSTTEAEYVSAAACACQGVWLKNVLSYLRMKQA
ncbi:putative CC-NBS-LRR resistance protein [Trifolium pratense]|uniref:Putative CC-NBS-LRR resistance protein n=1 Tax=Trifolium pratense TaxID=57577 RepID=A0A2K3PLM3_TRIPR|nr:putative CC-NBS-LRR resistance protein [Trifolium pratense]